MVFCVFSIVRLVSSIQYQVSRQNLYEVPAYGGQAKYKVPCLR